MIIMILMLIDHFQSIDLQKSFNDTIQFVPNLGHGIMNSSCNVQGRERAVDRFISKSLNSSICSTESCSQLPVNISNASFVHLIYLQ